jgi:IS5 family transposase
LIAAPSSTKNKEGKRDPEMHQTKKGNQWYHRCAEGFAYGMKDHIGVDKDSGLIHSVITTAANVHDLTPVAELLHGVEEVVYGDTGYQGIAKSQETRDDWQDKGIEGSDATRQTPSSAGYSRGAVVGSARNRQGLHPLEGGSPIQGDQAALRFSEDQAERTGQEPLQDQCVGSLDESVPGTAAVTRSSVSKGMVAPDTSILAQIPNR